jgi:formylglycine-generating enzyme required for sulfatase activity
MKSYVDFELEIERVGRKYRAKVIKAPRGRGARCSFTLPAEEELEGFRHDLANDRSSRHLEIDQPRRGSVEALGRRLFDKVFCQKVREAWRASRDRMDDRLRLRLHLEEDARLLAIPWELLFDPDRGRFVATERPVIRTLDSPTSPRPLAAPKPLRMLAVLSCPPDIPPLEVEREWSVLDQALGETMELKKSIPPTLDEIDHALRGSEWHILHFVGHGRADEEGGFLFLQGQEGTSRAVDHIRLGTFLGHESLRLVVLNACEGARPGRSDPFSGVAQALLSGGVPAVLAMQESVSDAAAIAFAKHFYGALAQGAALDEALLEARRALYRQSEAEWVIPVLYLNAPDGDLVSSGQGGVVDPPPVTGRLIAAAIAGGLLLLLGFWLWSRRDLDPDPATVASLATLPPRPPKGSADNPQECPSPPDLDIAFVKIPEGEFPMGERRGREKTVRISKAYCLGAYEVTRELWNRVMDNGKVLPDNERHLPEQGVTFDEAQQFLDRLNELDPSAHYRLPTEAEWERAARAGTRTRYIFGDDAGDLFRYGNCKGKDRFPEAAPVGQLQPNDWGLYDMYGNVAEWVSDWYAPEPDRSRPDPQGPREGEKKIRRGGSWNSSAKTCSSGARSGVKPNSEFQENGFRIVREIP